MMIVLGSAIVCSESEDVLKDNWKMKNYGLTIHIGMEGEQHLSTYDRIRDDLGR